MTRFLIDGDVNQRAVRGVPIKGKGFDVLFPEEGSFKAAEDAAIRKIAAADRRVLVSRDRDFEKFRLQPEEVPNGVILLRLDRTSQRKVTELLAGLCRVLQKEFPKDPYNFQGIFVEVHPDRVIIHRQGGASTSYPVPSPSNV